MALLQVCAVVGFLGPFFGLWGCVSPAPMSGSRAELARAVLAPAKTQTARADSGDGGIASLEAMVARYMREMSADESALWRLARTQSFLATLDSWCLSRPCVSAREQELVDACRARAEWAESRLSLWARRDATRLAFDAAETLEGCEDALNAELAAVRDALASSAFSAAERSELHQAETDLQASLGRLHVEASCMAVATALDTPTAYDKTIALIDAAMDVVGTETEGTVWSIAERDWLTSTGTQLEAIRSQVVREFQGLAQEVGSEIERAQRTFVNARAREDCRQANALLQDEDGKAFNWRFLGHPRDDVLSLHRALQFTDRVLASPATDPALRLAADTVRFEIRGRLSERQMKAHRGSERLPSYSVLRGYPSVPAETITEEAGRRWLELRHENRHDDEDDFAEETDLSDYAAEAGE